MTDDQKALLDYAQQFFTTANAITAACLLQTAAFVLGFAKDEKLVATMLRWRPYTSLGALVTSMGYGVAVWVCYKAELDLRKAAGQHAALAVEAQEVVHVEAETGDGRAEFEGVVRTVPVIVVEEEREAF